MWRLFFVIILFSIGAKAQILSADEAKEDIDVLYKRMQQIHPGLFRYQSPEAYEKNYLEIKASLTDSISEVDLFLKISPLIYQIKDLHTGFLHPKKWRKEHPYKLPFIMAEVEGKNLIQYNASADTTLVRGLELLEIDGKSIESVKEFLKTNIGTDNGNENAKQLYATKMLYAYYPKFFDLKDTVNLVLRNMEKDSVIQFKLATITTKQMGAILAHRYPEKIRKNLSYTVIDSTLALAKIDVTSFVFKGSPLDLFQTKFKRKFRKQIKQAKKDSIEHLVLDLRSNGGGYIPNISKVMKYVASEPYKLIDTMAFKRSAYFKVFSPLKGITPLLAPLYFNKKDSIYRYRATGKPAKKKPSKLVYKEKLYVFMDAASYSATTFTISLLDNMDRATFIGTIPGGANWGSHAGSWYIAKLPNSKISVRIPEYRIVHARSQKADESFFIQPDIKVEYTLEDFDKNIDSYERILIEKLKGN
ncbi:S41 family peptidase [uncultured Arcticibacterium sp.]|uniref:S41 family peptidase n=1 Tax=uncultured Arcticibacterium sp. TaxID=2173042 RepID=UPI0030FCBF28